MSIKGVRVIFDNAPLLLGKNPGRPAPVHVINGFLTTALGAGAAARGVRAMLTDGAPLPTPPVAESIRADPVRTARLRKSLSVALNPDRRAWGERFASVFPLHRAFVAQDPSDDGFGRAVWGLVATEGEELIPQLLQLLEPTSSSDALALLASVLADGLSADGKSSEPATDVAPPWPLKTGTLGHCLGGSLRDLIRASFAPNRTRSACLSSLSAATYFAAWLGALRTPILLAGGAKAWADVEPMFFFGGIPPGPPNDPAVRLAARSFEAVVVQHREMLRKLLTDRLTKVKIPAVLPKAQHASTLIRQAIPSLTDKQVDEILKVVKSAAKPENIAARMISEVYPPGAIESGFRAMGRKIGIAGPDRGYGSPRFLFETPILGLLVDGTLDAGERLAYDEWLDRLYDLFGFVVGIGKQHDGRVLLGRLEAPGPLFHALESNHDALRRRLIRAGLASEYSDSETEVHRHEEAR